MITSFRADPTRTGSIQKKFAAEISKRFSSLKKKLRELIVEEDAFLLKHPVVTFNVRWEFSTSAEKVAEFRNWLSEQIALEIFDSKVEEAVDAYWYVYARQGYEKGAGRAFEQTNKGLKITGSASFFEGAKSEFLRSSFANPVSIERVKILAARNFTDIKGVTDRISGDLMRTLTDGLVQGLSPRIIAKDVSNVLDTSLASALRIARTEIIRAHAEGQLDTFERLGIDSVGVAAEWSTAGDGRVCPLCEPMQGVVMSLAEARGAIPRHPNCRCMFIPANVGEKSRTKIIGGVPVVTRQKRSKQEIDKSIRESLKAEIPKKSKRTVAEQRQASRWLIADRIISKNRPKNVFKSGAK